LSPQGFPRRSAAALALCLWQATRASAAEEPPVELPEVVVPLSRGEAGADPTASATVIDARRFEGEAKGVAELVATSPGVAIRDYGGLGRLATVSIRGSTADGVRVLLDGLPLNTAAGGGVDLSTIPRHWIDRIEVVRGAEGAHYGTGALGGVVNVITRPAVAGNWSAQATGGSFLTFGGAADGAIGGEGWAGMAAASFDSTSGRFEYLFDDRPAVPGNALQLRLRENNAARLGGVLLKAWRALGQGRLDLMGQASFGWRQLPGWPYALTPNDLQQEGRGTLSGRYAFPLASSLTLSTEIAGRLEGLDVRLAPPSGSTQQTDLAGGARVQLAWAHPLGTLTTGASLGGERLWAEGTAGAAQHSRADFAVWATDDLTLLSGALRIGPALRFDAVGAYSGLSGKLGASWRFAGPLAVRASAGRSFRAPSFGELYLQQGLLEPNPLLQPEEAWSADAALVAEGALGYASLGGFASLYRNLIVYEPASFDRLKPFNDGKAFMGGLEVEVASAPWREALGLTAALSYTFLASENLKGEEAVLGKQVPHQPRHRLYARLGIDVQRAGAHLEAQVVGLQYQDARNLLPIPAAFAMNMGAFLRVLDKPDVRIFLEVKNLLDDLTLQNGFGYPLPGRTLLFTVRVGSTQEG
jgi:iron complex outermembrane receptor protein